MNVKLTSRSSVAALAVSLLGCLLLVYALVKTVQHYMQPPPLNATRVEERQKALAELRAREQEQTQNYGWVDQAHGIVRLPITNAMELTIREYRNPSVARTNLLTRLEQATKPLPKPEPPPNPFE